MPCAEHAAYVAENGPNGLVRLTIEHLLPLSRGGKSVLTNVYWACVSCNNKKGSKKIHVYVKEANCPPNAPIWEILEERSM